MLCRHRKILIPDQNTKKCKNYISKKLQIADDYCVYLLNNNCTAKSNRTATKKTEFSKLQKCIHSIIQGYEFIFIYSFFLLKIFF